MRLSRSKVVAFLQEGTLPKPTYVVLLAISMSFLAVNCPAQTPEPMVYAAAATSKFVTMPTVPACMTIAVQSGDPTKGGSTLLLKVKPGCVIPWHWHTANEHLMVVSGSGKAEMKDGKPLSLKPGDFLLLPARGTHQFTASTNMEMFDVSDAAFDIHYVDASGKEIPVEKALTHGAKDTKSR